MIHSAILAPKVAAVTVEYDAKGQRVRKEFTDVFASRRFYLAKSKAGANPKIVSASLK